MDQFYMNGGTTTFVDRLAAVLGIHVSSIKVVGVYEGSLVVDYNIFQTQEGGSATNGTFLEAVKRRQMEVVRDTGTDPNIPVDWLGAPVLDFSAGSSGETQIPVVSDGVLTVEAFVALTGLEAEEFDPAQFIITSTGTNSGGISTRVIEPDYIHVDTTVVFKPEEEVRPDYIPDSDIKIVDMYEQQIQDKAAEAARQIEREQSKSTTTKSIIIAAVVIIGLGIVVVLTKFVMNYSKLQQLDMQKIKNKQFNDTQEMKKFDQDGDTLNYTSEQKCLDDLQMQYDPTMAKTNADGFFFGNLEPGNEGQEGEDFEAASRPDSKPTSGEQDKRRFSKQPYEVRAK